jgi:hypothetical protein
MAEAPTMIKPPRGTVIPFLSNSRMCPVVGFGMGISPKLRENKQAPSGEPTYSTGCLLQVLAKDGSIRIDKTASINVIHPLDEYELGKFYHAEGKVWIQPYELNGRIAYSITVERLVEAAV